MMLYQHSDEDDDTTPLLVPTILPSATTTTTRSSRSSKRIIMVVVVAAMTMLVVTGGTVWLRNGSSYTTAAEGLVVATHDNVDCIAPIDATFGGTSTTTTIGKSDAFQTCYQYGHETKYCWSNSYTAINFFQTLHYQCVPKGRRLMDGVWLAGQWDDIDPKYVNTPGVDPNTNPKRCGPPCQDMFCG